MTNNSKMKPKNNLVSFLRKIEGKEPTTPKEYPLPQFTNEYYFYTFCRTVLTVYKPGDTLSMNYRDALLDRFTWPDLNNVLWYDMYATGYIHEECYKSLSDWADQIRKGIAVENRRF